MLTMLARFVAPILALVVLLGAAYPDWDIRIVTDDEPGEPLIVTGIVYALDGKTPLPRVHVHVYQTDARGLYADEDAEPGTHRISGDLVTNLDGRYRIRTIRPAPYPNSSTPAHIHFIVNTRETKNQEFDLRFEGDPGISKRSVEEERANGTFGLIRPIALSEDGVPTVRFDLRVKP